MFILGLAERQLYCAHIQTNGDGIQGRYMPIRLALHHPVAELLLQYATQGCPTNTGRPWTVMRMEAAVMRGPHVSALQPEAMDQLAMEVEVKANEKKV